MKQFLIHITMLCVFMISHAQQEFHVFPKNHTETPGTQNGVGSITNPWDLQTALIQKPNIIKSGDTIWVHQGVYNGRFISKIKSLETNKYITVSAYKNERVILNGNVDSSRNAVLEVRGEQVIFKNFEITWLGDFSRDETDVNFKPCAGLRHLTGENCRFYNLKIYNNPGLGIGSWKHAAGSVIENCKIFYNGFIAKDGKGRGEGIYVQNKSDEVRLLKNNVIFNNYYKGIEVWSAGKRSDFQFVKHITLDQNIIFNSGSPAGRFYDNVIVASNDKNGINVAKHISVVDNVLYHNTNQANGNLFGDAPSLTLGFIPKAPIEDVVVDGNVIVGGYNGLRILQAKSLQFTNNIIHTGIVHIGKSISEYSENWNLNTNTIYSSLKKPFRIPYVQDHSLNTWNRTFNLDNDSQVLPITEFILDPILHFTKNNHQKNTFQLALFNANGNDVVVDFSNRDLQAGLNYSIYDVENPNIVVKKGTLTDDLKIAFPMQLSAFEKPLHNSEAKKTLSNFGVFVIKFEAQNTTETSEDKPSLLQQFFNWLGF